MSEIVGVDVGEKFQGFDPAGYELINYGDLDPLDVRFRRVMAGVIGQVMGEIGVKLGGLQYTHEACTGPWPIGTTMLAPYIARDAKCLTTDISTRNVAKLNRAFELGKTGDLGVWEGQRPGFDGCGPEWAGALEKICELCVAEVMDVDESQEYEGKADAVTSCCGVESSTSDPRVFKERLRKVVKLARPGGFVGIYWSDKSSGYYAGTDEEGNPVWCPAVPISQEDVRSCIGDMLDNEIYLFVPDRGAKRQDADSPHTWQGLGCVVAQRRLDS